MAACWAPSTWAWESNAGVLSDGIVAAAASANSRQNADNSIIDPGLKLGKRTFLEDPVPNPSKNVAAASLQPPATLPPPPPPAATRKKPRGPSQPPPTPICQVEGCSADLSGSKPYHRRHRVCVLHSKAPKSIVKGLEQRFCQQCSRFHALGYFDEGKRSCRRRLAGHNQRRRKPPPPDPFAMPALAGGGFFAGDFARNFVIQSAPHHHHQHLLDGSFIVSKSNWPSSSPSSSSALSSSSSSSRLLLQDPAYLASFFQAKLKNEMASLQSSIASEGVYQFLKCHSSASSPSPSPPSPGASILSCNASIESGIAMPVSTDALSLLSAEQWPGSGSPAPLAIASAAAGLIKPSPLPPKIDDSFQLQLQLHQGIGELLEFQKHRHHVFDA